ncbi:MAG: Coenzyme F420 hydrogenase/dehydrogenase, beta subunit C-terminal domain [Candidatus Helarchaeota archaeon]
MTISNNSDSGEVLPKSFEDLIIEVHEKGICGQCGGCVSFCSAGEIKAIQMNENGPPTYLNKDNCLHCGICYLICPQIHVLDNELKNKYNWKYPIGFWNRISSAQAASQGVRDVATDGGVVTAILMYLMENNLIDGAIVTRKKGLFSRESFFATSTKDLLEAAGSKFDLPTQTLDYQTSSTFTPVISKLKDLMDADLMNIAVVGTPCQIHSIRKMQQLGIMPAHVIEYVLGLFCYENFMFSGESWKKMEDKFKFSMNDLRKINIKDKVIFGLHNADPVLVDLSGMSEFMRPACTACSDFSNIYADISFGGLGSQNGFTTVLTRTKKGLEIYEKALDKGYVIEPHDKNSPVLKSAMLAKIISFAKRKIKRSKDRLAET